MGDPREMEALLAQVEAWKAEDPPPKLNVLVISPDPAEKETTVFKRAVHGTCAYVAIRTPWGFVDPRPGTRAHEGGFVNAKDREGNPVAAGEKTGMINDWDNHAVVAALLGVPLIMRLFNTIYASPEGPWYMVPERAGRRSERIEVDFKKNKDGTPNWDEPTDALRATTHVDHPEWKKVPWSSDIPRETIIFLPNEIVLCVLRQDLPHAIPRGGNSINWFFSPQRYVDMQSYVNKTVRTCRRYIKQKSLFMWGPLQEALRLCCDKWLYVRYLAATVAYELQPVLYPGGKLNQNPSPQAVKPFKHLKSVGGVHPPPSRQTVDPVAECERLAAQISLNDMPPYILAAFEWVRDNLPGKWVCAPSKLTHMHWEGMMPPP